MSGEFVSYTRCSVLPMLVDQTFESTRFYKKGASIAEKHSEIAVQLRQIRNAREGLGVSTYSLNKLSATFEKAYDKATASYWRGGIRDPFWRCLATPDSPGFLCSMVADQLDECCADLMTPSARRFLKVLTSLSEALETERQILSRCEQVVAANDVARHSASCVSPDDGWGPLDEAKRSCLALRNETSPLVDRMREAVDRARANVRPEKKHHGKREAINGGLYLGAVVVSVIALAVTSSIVAVVGFVVTMLIRCVSLGSIRGFDREKGWKAVESLLDQAKDFINSEEYTMHRVLDTKLLLAQFDQEKLNWERGQRALALGERALERADRMLADMGSLRQHVGVIDQNVGSLQKNLSVFQQDVGSLRKDVGVVQQDVGSLRKDVGVLQQDMGSLRQDVGVLRNDMGSLRGDVGTLQQDMGSVKQSVGTLQKNFVALSDDFKDMRNMIMFDSASRRGAPPISGPSSAVAPQRSSMERATSLETFQAPRVWRSVQPQRDLA